MGDGEKIRDIHERIYQFRAADLMQEGKEIVKIVSTIVKTKKK